MAKTIKSFKIGKNKFYLVKRSERKSMSGYYAYMGLVKLTNKSTGSFTRRAKNLTGLKESLKAHPLG